MGTTIVNDEDNGSDLARLQGSCQLLYPSTCPTKLAATMLLMNICTFHGVSNKFVDELMCLLHTYLLSLNNCLPSNMYHAKTLTKKVGFNYHIIHACPNGCILFQGVHIDLDTCPKRWLAWYKDVGRALYCKAKFATNGVNLFGLLG